MEQVDAVVVGGGQAGLAASYHLSRHGVEHVVLERGRIGERWRSERWDSLMFQFPNWSVELPGLRLDAPDPDAFSHKDAIVAFIERYSAWCKAPVRTGSQVLALRRHEGAYAFELVLRDRRLAARHVIVATGPYQRPRIPALHRQMPPHVTQLHAADYRNAAVLPPGAVLVVGCGASGCQIADELLESGRRTFFAIGRHRRVPRRYRGRDVFWWRREIGELDQSVDATPVERRQPAPLVTGVRGGYDVDPRRSAARGICLLGRVRAVADSMLGLDTDVEAVLLEGDRSCREFMSAVDRYVAIRGLDVMAPDESAKEPASPALAGPAALDLAQEGVGTVIWATGYDLDFSWVQFPVFDGRGAPLQYRGATRIPGLYFLGLQWLHKSKSSFLYGVGEDAAHIVECIAGARRTA